MYLPKENHSFRFACDNGPLKTTNPKINNTYVKVVFITPNSFFFLSLMLTHSCHTDITYNRLKSRKSQSKQSGAKRCWADYLLAFRMQGRTFGFYSIRLKWMLPLPLSHFTQIVVAQHNSRLYCAFVIFAPFQIIFSKWEKSKVVRFYCQMAKPKANERTNERANVWSLAQRSGFVKINIIYLHSHQHWWNHYHLSLGFLAKWLCAGESERASELKS